MSVADHDMQMHQYLTTLEQNSTDTNFLLADNTEVLRDLKINFDNMIPTKEDEENATQKKTLFVRENITLPLAQSIDEARKIEMKYFSSVHESEMKRMFEHFKRIIERMDLNTHEVIQIIHDNNNSSRYRDEQISSEISDLKQIIQKSRETERELEETKTELSVCKANMHKLLKLNN